MTGAHLHFMEEQQMEPRTINSLGRRLTRALFCGTVAIDPWDELNFHLRFSVALADMQEFLRTESPNDHQHILETFLSLRERFSFLNLSDSDAEKYIDDAVLHIEWLSNQKSVPVSPTCDSVNVSEHTGSVSTMLYDETRAYYKWLTSTLAGVGDVVEFGCGFGGSTCALAEGMQENTHCTGRHLYAIDTFIFRAWMRRFLARSDALKSGQSFLSNFQANVFPFRKIVRPCRLIVSSSPLNVPHVFRKADATSVELIVYDMGPSYEYLSAIWASYCQRFIPGRTIIVFNEYGNARAEQLRRFCRDLSSQLKALHKPPTSVKSFLYVGDTR